MPPQRVFELLSNADRRSEWDLQFRSGELVRRLDVEGCGEQAGNALLHVVFEPLSAGRGAKGGRFRYARRLLRTTPILFKYFKHNSIK